MLLLCKLIAVLVVIAEVVASAAAKANAIAPSPTTTRIYRPTLSITTVCFVMTITAISVIFPKTVFPFSLEKIVQRTTIPSFVSSSNRSRLQQQQSLLLSPKSNPLSKIATQRVIKNNYFSYNKRRIIESTEKMMMTTSSSSLGPGELPVVDTTWTKLPPLIDVDCNLWHVDLQKSILPDPSSSKNNAAIAAATNDGNDDDSDTINLHILDTDAVYESNIIAMISPSSTIQEAIKGINYLRNLYSTNDSINNDNKGQLVIKTTIGIHPYHVNGNTITTSSNEKWNDYFSNNDNDDDNNNNNNENELVQYIKNNRQYIVGIGECGLDDSDGFPPIEQQLPYFQKQIELCELFNHHHNNNSSDDNKDQPLPPLILFVHERNAFESTFQLLQQSKLCPEHIIIHCFTGTVQECTKYITAGYLISISGSIFRDIIGSGGIIDCLEQNIIPLNRLMIETDAPYMGFTNCRQAFLEKNQNTIQANNYNGKIRKKLMASTYPNVPSSLVQILHKVLEHINNGRRKKQNGGSSMGDDNNDNNGCLSLLTAEELAIITTQNANRFFHLNMPTFEIVVEDEQ